MRHRLFLIADDSMGGRATGSWGNYQAANYIAAEFKRLGLKPAGENGGWFQVVPFFRQAADPNGTLVVGSATLRIGRDYIIATSSTVPRPLEGKRVVFGGSMTDSSTWISADSARDRVVVFSGPPRASFLLARTVTSAARFAGAAAVALPVLESIPADFAAALMAGRVMTDTSRTAQGPGRLFITAPAVAQLLGRSPEGAAAGTLGDVVHGTGTVSFSALPYAARNVIAVLPGRDRKLAGTYVALTSHNDHVGFDHAPVDHDSLRARNLVVRPMGADSPEREPTAQEWVTIRQSLDSLRRLRPPRLDSIRNGADDDGSGTAALLEVAEALSSGANRPRRSVLFVSHAAEEEGLRGSQWFTDHPTVTRDSIVSEFDMDMIARGGVRDVEGGGPGYLEVIGMRRLSKEYGDIIEAANAKQPLPFAFNLTFDAPGHPLQYYCRADHYSYARYDIPAVAVSRGEHADYHQVTDEAQYADFDGMVRVAKLAESVVRAVGNLDHRPFVDFARHDPKAQCRQ